MGHLEAAHAQVLPATNRPAQDLAVDVARLASFIQQPRFAQAQWGIKVVSLNTGKVIFEHNADKLMIPASTAKLFTCALALDRLGPDYRIKTSVYASTKPDATGTLRGDLLIYGRGDPSMSARFNNGDHSKALQPLVDAIAASGIKRIEGDLIGDESYFKTPPFGGGWASDDLQWAYAAPVSALTADDNASGFSVKPGKQPGAPCQIIGKTNFLTFYNRSKTTARTTDLEINRPLNENNVYISGGLPVGASYSDALSIHDPPLWFVTLLRESLAQRGITVSGRLRTINWLSDSPSTKMIEVASAESRPLAEIVKETLKTSQNLYAQLLLLQVGAKSQGNQSAEQTGLAEMRKFLKETGIQPGTAIIKDGSGLSANSLLTPEASVTLLSFMSRHRHASTFLGALPIAGVDGTLRDRLKGCQKRVWAKTGTKEHTSALAGYALGRNNERLVFSVILNNYKGALGNQTPRAESDALVQILMEL